MEIFERMLLYGGAGTGKTTAYLRLAEKFPSKPFRIIDTDDSIHRLINTEFSHLTNVEAYPSQSWEDCEDALAKIQAKHKAGDWVVVDFLDSAWDFVAAYFVEQIFGKKIDDYFLEARRNLKGTASLGSGFEGWKDWSVINKIYQDWINTICYKLKANVVLVAKASALFSSDSKEALDLFSSIGFRPEGEKRNAFRVHTVLYLLKDRSGWKMTTVKDRGRRYLKEVPVVDFGEQYGALAGWE